MRSFALYVFVGELLKTRQLLKVAVYTAVYVYCDVYCRVYIREDSCYRSCYRRRRFFSVRWIITGLCNCLDYLYSLLDLRDTHNTYLSFICVDIGLSSW